MIGKRTYVMKWGAARRDIHGYPLLEQLARKTNSAITATRRHQRSEDECPVIAASSDAS